MPVGQYRSERSSCDSQTKGYVENAISNPHTGRRGFGLPFEALLKENFLLALLPFGGYCSKFVLETTPEEKNNRH
jgi:hypothetical protein